MSPDTRPAIGRNDPCHCGSGRKYKVCCLAKDEADARAARAQSAAAAPADAQGQAAARRPPRRRGVRQQQVLVDRHRRPPQEFLGGGRAERAGGVGTGQIGRAHV